MSTIKWIRNLKSTMKLFSVKNIPIVSWSSGRALNFRPRVITLCILCIGLAIFGIGDALLIASGAGNSPWTVLSQGVLSDQRLEHRRYNLPDESRGFDFCGFR